MSNEPLHNDSVETLLRKLILQLQESSTQGGTWGTISGDINSQTDLATYVAGQIAAGLVWGALTGQVTNQTDLVNYIQTQISSATLSAIKSKGGINCSANPNYPAASAQDLYYVTVAGKIGGSSGPAVEVGDTMICINNTAAGTHASVGSNWIILNINIPGLTTLGTAFATMVTPAGERFLRANADGSITLLTAAQLLSATNSTVGASIGSLATPAGDRFIKVASDGTATLLTAAQLLSSIGADNASNLTSGTVPFARLVNTQLVGDANASITSGKRDVLLTASITAARSYTLPAAADYPSGSRITFTDMVGTLTGTNTATLQAGAVGDTVNGASTVVLSTPNASVLLISDGVSKWNLDIRGIARGGTGATTAAAARTNLGVPPINLVGTPCEIQLAASDETTAITAGNGKVTFRMPYAMTLTGVRASLGVAQSTGSTFTVGIKKDGVSVLSTNLTVANNSRTSVGGTPAVISNSALTDDSEVTIDVTQVGDGTAKGLKVTLIGTRA